MKCKLVANVLYDYTASLSDELSIQKDDRLIITDATDPDWWTAVKLNIDTFGDTAGGLVPVNYVEEVLIFNTGESSLYCKGFIQLFANK